MLRTLFLTKRLGAHLDNDRIRLSLRQFQMDREDQQDLVFLHDQIVQVRQVVPVVPGRTDHQVLEILSDQALPLVLSSQADLVVQQWG